MSEDEELQIVGEILAHTGGYWDVILSHLKIAGYSEDEANTALAQFGRRIGREL